MKLDYSLTPGKGIHSKWIKNLNIRPATIKLLKENIDSMLFDIGLSSIVLNMSPQARETKAKINKWDYIQIKSFCPVKKTIKIKRLPTEWKKIFAFGTSGKGLTCKIYKELI